MLKQRGIEACVEETEAAVERYNVLVETTL
jgi:hypothetical protein